LTLFFRNQNNKTEIGDQTQISSIWLAEMATLDLVSRWRHWAKYLVASHNLFQEIITQN
jgi:hypothetical protein